MTAEGAPPSRDIVRLHFPDGHSGDVKLAPGVEIAAHHLAEVMRVIIKPTPRVEIINPSQPALPLDFETT